jgi:diguanylate cyclase (GGDEF)-like protein
MDTTGLRDRFRLQSVTYPLAGALLALGAPAGLLLMRRLVLGDRSAFRDDVRRDFATYAYLTTSTTLVFTLVGGALGRHADRLAKLSTTDGLTGLLNPRAFHTRLEEEVERSRRSGAPITLLLLDLDRLKALNDRHGHVIGDRALERIAGAIRGELRSIDVGARVGGDEFGLLAVGTDRTAAGAVANRLQRTIEAERDTELGLQITASIGIATFDPAHDRLLDVRDLTRAADAALYEAKATGRNRVVVGNLRPLHRT